MPVVWRNLLPRCSHIALLQHYTMSMLTTTTAISMMMVLLGLVTANR